MLRSNLFTRRKSDSCVPGSDLSEIDEVLPTEDGISRTSASSSLDIDPAEGVPPDDVSSFQAVSIPAENQVLSCLV